MSLVHQQPLPGMDSYKRQPSAMEILAELASKTDDPTVAAAVAKSIVELQQSAERFQWEREERQAKIEFDEALNRCQKSIGRIAPNQSRNDTRSFWADYAQLDRAVRPIYTAEGFSIAFSEVQSITPGKVRIQAELSRSGVSKFYFSEITPTTIGPKGGAMATATDADAIAQSRAKRYIMLDIFNIAVGIDQEEKMGIPKPITEEQSARLQDWEDALRNAPDLPQLKNTFADAYKYAASINDVQKAKMNRVYNECKARFQQ